MLSLFKPKEPPVMDAGEPEKWFSAALQAGRLDPHPGTVHYVADMMFIGVANGATVLFKHRMTREYIRIPVVDLVNV